jgi:hypothetical protein
MAQAVGLRSFRVEARVLSQANRYGICGGRIDTGTVFFHSFSLLLCRYHSTIAPYSFVHHRSSYCMTLGNGG